MLLIFWEIGEKPDIKNNIAKKLRSVEIGLKKFAIPVFSPSVEGESPQGEGVDTKKKHIDYTVKIIFTDSKKIKYLNKTYRNINEETDVLSFSELDSDKRYPDLQEEKSLGEIYINYDWVTLGKSPLERGGPALAGPGCVNLKEKINITSILFLHGYLHLLGHDHEKDKGGMEMLEKKLRKSTL